MNKNLNLPEPWQIGNNPTEFGRYNANHITVVGSEESICMVYGIPLHTTLEDVSVNPSELTLKGLMNARIIAAAPLLLKTLIAARDRAVLNSVLDVHKLGVQKTYPELVELYGEPPHIKEMNEAISAALSSEGLTLR